MASPSLTARIGALAAVLGIFNLPKAFAETVTYELTSLSQFDTASSTGLINTVAGRIQAQVAPSGTAANALNFGDGSDGAFSDGPTQTGISVSGSTVTFNTDTKSTYKFTSFNLSSGVTLTATGSNPLVIRVYGSATVAGTVSLVGAAGTANGVSGGGGATTGVLAGGSGVLGGGSGGRGAQTDGTAGTDGSHSTGSGPVGEFGVNAAAGFVESGGGGCNSDTFTAPGGDGSDNGGSAGVCTAGTTVEEAFESSFTGGAGGGGGGACTLGGCGTGVGGSGAGAGAGAFRLVALGNITVTGTINVTGGAGGANNADLGGVSCGGGGGGGAGGSVWLQTPGSLTGAGGVTLTGGTRGIATVGNCLGGPEGGNGASGRHRLDGTDSSATIAPTLTVAVQIPTGQSYVVYTNAIDLSSGYSSIDSASETTGCGTDGTLTVTYQSSPDGTTWSTGVTASEITSLRNVAYVRAKVALSTTGTSAPCLTALSITHSASILTDLELEGQPLLCGSTERRSGGGAPPSAYVGNLALLALALWLARRPLRILRNDRRRISSSASPLAFASSSWIAPHEIPRRK